MAEIVIGGLNISANMLLGPLNSAVGFVLDLVVDQIKLWDKNKFEASTLQQFLVQTRGHMQLLSELEAQLAAEPERANIGEVIGRMLSDYKQLGDWLFMWNAKSATAFGRLVDWGKRVAKAQKYAEVISLQKERIGNAFVKNLAIINTLLSGKLLQGQDLLKLGQDEQMRKLSAIFVSLRTIEDLVQGKAAEDGIREGDIVLSDELLGCGAFGEVRKAILKKDGKSVEVAVKMLHRTRHSGAELIAKFQKEIDLVRQANRQCSPAYVCRFYGACSIDRQLCLVMKRYTSSLTAFVEGAEGGKLDLRLSCQLGLRIAVGLQELHQAGFAHLDIKPDNVLLDLADNPVLCDFALARHFRDSGTVYLTSNRIGTANYMAPECVFSAAYKEQGGIGFKADIWSFAATMVHMLTGTPPFSGLAEAEWLGELHLKNAPASLALKGYEAVSKMLADCFSFVPSSRPSLTTIIEVLKAATPVPSSLSASAVPQGFQGDSARSDAHQASSRDAGGHQGSFGASENSPALANQREKQPAVKDPDVAQRGPSDQPATQATKTSLHRQHAPTASPPRTAGEAQARAQKASERGGQSIKLAQGVYNGESKNGKPHGFGVLVYPDGHNYEGGWKNGDAHGLGVFRGADGSRYDGEWKDDKRNGHGFVSLADGSSYKGVWKDDQWHGQGVFTASDGGQYDGNWGDGKQSGHGVYTWPDRSRFRGEWRDGKRSGHGVYTWPDGSRYEGGWKKNKKDGQGVQTVPNGDRYVGGFVDSNMHGMGVYSWADGSRYAGEFVNGWKQGQGVYTSAKRGSWTGEWDDDEPRSTLGKIRKAFMDRD